MSLNFNFSSWPHAVLQFKSLSSNSASRIPLLLVTDALWPSGGEQGGVFPEDLVNLQSWEGPALLVSWCGLFSATDLPVVVPPVHASASSLGIEACVCLCVCVSPPLPWDLKGDSLYYPTLSD